MNSISVRPNISFQDAIATVLFFTAIFFLIMISRVVLSPVMIVLKEEMSATEEELIDLCKENLASYKKPRTIEFRRELPKSPTGKILKRVIREAFWKGRDRSV